VSDGAVGTGVGHRPWVDHHRAERREQQVDTPSCRFVSREIARELAKKGARVAVHYRTDREAAQETLASLKSPLQNYSANAPDRPSSRGLANRNRRHRSPYVLGERLRARLRWDGRLCRPGALQLLALARYGGATVNWSGAGGWIYLLFVLSVFGVGLYGLLEARRRIGRFST
jgi:hypothetical protein